jgi:serine/threonine protein kinase
MGTPAYMAPEQARGENLDPRCDLFSLGCVLYRLCTGQLPFQGPDSMSVLMALARENPMPVCLVNLEMPAALSDLIEKLLAKNAVDRPASAHAVVEALRAIEAGELSQSTPQSAAASRAMPRATRRDPAPRRTLLVWGAAAVLLAVGGAVGALLALGWLRP